jgi:long-chain acyl-CoA synthetase
VAWPEDPLPPLWPERHFGRAVRCFADRPPHVPAIFEAALARNPDGDALIAADLRLTYRALQRRVAEAAAALAGLGVAPGDRVALLLGNRPEFLITLLATLEIGGVAVPLSIREQTPALRFMLAHSGARVLIHEASLEGRLPAATDLPQLAHRLAAESLPAATAPPPRHEPREEDVAVILYTSGTTGRPKGALLTHLNIVHSVLHYTLAMDLTSRDRSLLAVPASHVTGLVAVLLTMLHAAACTVLLPVFKAGDFLATAAGERMTHAVLVPAMYNLCLLDPAFASHDLAAWRIGAYGGAPMPAATIERLATLLPDLRLMNLYGATETASPATIMPAHHTFGHAGAVGLPVPCGELRITDADGHEVSPGTPGEIRIGGPMVVPGYWQADEASAAAFPDGFWRSGDIGSRDAEGYLFVHDRLKDMINRAGYKVYSVEVEHRLCQHPDVLEAAVVARPDPVLGEKVQAFVTAKTPDLRPAALRAFCATALADYKVPDVITLCAAPLPRNANGKLIKTALRQRAAAEAAG